MVTFVFVNSSALNKALLNCDRTESLNREVMMDFGYCLDLAS